MKSSFLVAGFKTTFTVVLLVFAASLFAQQTPLPKAKTESFWERVDVGGGFGLAISNDYTNVMIAPSAIYNFTDRFALGSGLQYSNLKQKNYYSSHVYGASLIGLFSPIEEVQLSLELEEVNVNNRYMDLGGNLKRSFWNTGLFVGGGYRQENITIGGRVNLLFDKYKDIYGSAFMPFVRVFF